MSEVTKKSDTSSSQMRLLGGTPHIMYILYVGSLGNWWHEWKLEFGNYDRNTGWSDSKKLENCVCQAARSTRPGLDGWSYIQQQRVHSGYL